MQEAQYYCSQKSKNAIYKGLNSYKSVYIKSLVDEDENLRIKALQGLIQCSQKLGLGINAYKKELYDLLNRHKKASKKSSRLKNIKVTKGSSLPSPNRLKKVILGKGYIEYFFDKPLDKKYSKKISQNKSSYKIIYIIEGKVATKYRNYRLKTVKSMRIVQKDKNYLQIIFEDPEKFSTDSSVEGAKLKIFLWKKTRPKALAKSSPKLSIIPPSIIYSKKIIVIDAGHGGKDSGAVGYKGKREKDIVLQIAKRVYKKLKAKGFKVYLTRRGDYFVTLRNRTKFANRVKANLFISIHANAAPTKSKYLMMKGIETFFLSPARSERAKRIAALENRVDMKNLSYYSKNVFLNFINKETTILSNKLAIDIQRNVLYTLRKKYHVVDGGVRPGPFWVLVGAQMPAILIEVGYITNPTEAMRISNPYYQNLLAEGVVKGVESYFQHKLEK
ncbi:N-acetylmuramoyl-L-alanine amidase [Nitratiruptor sp. YY09-18]|uniref:N-acetylmuramoyl-L-alanine amidase family protein n=1 Tax=Nitratiruptor sp. YY09-18 TaxID=2724901 RepID=UPI00191661DF|nr:N-acetylmuramoyl-L-alanine amidase [Nitratiruptor sp. YY09-18]BCD67979.1 N-acetylmuramoyl-L-alanine amidase [Nitratiruptor sp. YY09-18]